MLDTAGKWPFMEDVTSDFVYVPLIDTVGNCRDPGKIFSRV